MNNEIIKEKCIECGKFFYKKKYSKKDYCDDRWCSPIVNLMGGNRERIRNEKKQETFLKLRDKCYSSKEIESFQKKYPFHDYNSNIKLIIDFLNKERNSLTKCFEDEETEIL